MPVKYICQKCGKRFMDWGAEKLGYRCPDCEDSELVRASEHEAAKPKKKTSLKRKKAAAKKKPAKKKPAKKKPAKKKASAKDNESAVLIETSDDSGGGDSK